MKCRIQFSLLFVFGLFFVEIPCHKILGLFPAFGKSHYIVGSALMKGLAKAGHDVTIVSAFKEKQAIPNYREIYLNGILEDIYKGRERNFVDLNEMNYWPMISDLQTLGILVTNLTMNHPKVLELVSSDAKFDLIIVEIFVSEALLSFGYRFNAPTVGISPFGASKWTTNLVGSPLFASFIPHTFTGYSDRMTFFQRMKNSLVYWFDDITTSTLFHRKQEQLYDAYFPHQNKPTLSDLKRNVSMVLLNTHVTLGYPRPYATNMIEVGGMHINLNAEKLSKDIQTFMDSAPDGAIYFSMGSNIKSAMFPPGKLSEIVKVFSELKNMRILFKGEPIEELANISNNILLRSWFPQEAVLAHPNLKIFITHGGLLSTTEAIYFGVPVIGVPVFGDQALNMGQAEMAGYGLKIELPKLSEDTLRAAITEVMNNPKYSNQAKTTSFRYRDQLKSPLETAIYWVEYVIRHRGAPHLHSIAADLPLYQLYNCDVWAVIITVSLILTLALFKLITTALAFRSYSLLSPGFKED